MENSNISPQHYKSHPSGIEAITIAEHFNFCLGNAIKYIWRAGLKTDSPLEDLCKARWYLNREISRLEYEEEQQRKLSESLLLKSYLDEVDSRSELLNQYSYSDSENVEQEQEEKLDQTYIYNNRPTEDLLERTKENLKKVFQNLGGVSNVGSES